MVFSSLATRLTGEEGAPGRHEVGGVARRGEPSFSPLPLTLSSSFLPLLSSLPSAFLLLLLTLTLSLSLPFSSFLSSLRSFSFTSYSSFLVPSASSLTSPLLAPLVHSPLLRLTPLFLPSLLSFRSSRLCRLLHFLFCGSPKAVAQQPIENKIKAPSEAAAPPAPVPIQTRRVLWGVRGREKHT